MRENLPAWAFRLVAMIKRLEAWVKACSQKLDHAKTRLLFRTLIGGVRAVRPYRFKPQTSRPLDFLQYLALILYVPILFFMYAGDKQGYSVFFTYAVGVIAVAIFVIESIRLGKRFAHWKFAVKAFYGLFTLALGFIASSIAKNYANNVTQIDPKYLSDFTGLLTVLITWIFVLTSIPIAIFILSACRFFVLSLCITLFVALQISLQGFYPKIRQLPDLIWRLLTKDKTGFPKLRFFMLPAFHFLGAGIACAVLLAPLSLLNTYRIQTETRLTQLLVLMDYRPYHSCSAATGSRVAFLERGHVSVATQTGDSYQFSVIQCDLKPTK
jgi:hypothetical protein